MEGDKIVSINKLTNEELIQRAAFLRSQYSGSLDTIHYVLDADVIDELLASRAELERLRAQEPKPMFAEITDDAARAFCRAIANSPTISGGIEDIKIGLRSAIASFYAEPKPLTVPDTLHSPVIPDGWVLVPKKPTIDMVEAGALVVMDGTNTDRAQACWFAMFAEAPAAPE